MSEASNSKPESRQEAMGVLSHANPGRLGQLWGDWADKPGFHRVRGPETGLVMVRGRAGGGGNPFNLGEATVTRATVRLETGEVGHAYCLGRDGDKAVVQHRPREHREDGSEQGRDQGGSMDMHHPRRRRSRRVLAGTALAALVAASLTATLPSYAADEELVVNGGFEDGTAGWFVNNGNATDEALPLHAGR